MHTTGMSFKGIGRQMGYHYTVVNRLVRKHTQTNNVEAETGSRLTNGSCTMSLNSNNVVLNIMPNVIIDVGLPTVDV
jgi:hypothetical protein